MSFCKRSLGRCLLLFGLTMVLASGLSFGQEVQTADTVAVEPADTPTKQASEGAGEVSASGLSTDAGVIAKGKEVFTNICAACHDVHEKKVGPPLANVWERKDIPWLIEFIKYPQKIIDSGDEYAADLYAQYKASGYMPNHDFLSDDEIKSILAYVQEETLNPTTKAPAASAGTGEAQAAKPVFSRGVLFLIIGGLTLVLVIMAVTLFLLASLLTQYLSEEDKLTAEDQAFVHQRFSLSAVFRSPMFLGIAAFLFLAVGAKTVVDGLFSIGVQQGYAPEQPIKFSHKLHAGYYEIDCKYCHTGVEKSKSANIPSANICMNCHNSIRQESPEIQKIYAAIENNEPIQWVRIHNLPDLAYFNHAQHVKVGGLPCESCHGEIEKMEVVQQHSLLTMGWCVDCHRKTEINTKGNDYYTKLVALHNKTSKKPLNVEDIGGLECAKCHY